MTCFTKFFFLLCVTCNYYACSFDIEHGKVSVNDVKHLNSKSKMNVPVVSTNENPVDNTAASLLLKRALLVESVNLVSSRLEVPTGKEKYKQTKRFIRSAESMVEPSKASSVSNASKIAKTGDQKSSIKVTPTNLTADTESFAPKNPNDTDDVADDYGPVTAHKPLTKDAMMRGFYVFLGCSFIVMVYLGAKFFYQRRKKAYRKVSRGDELDMFPLTVSDGDDDDEIFSANMHH